MNANDASEASAFIESMLEAMNELDEALEQQKLLYGDLKVILEDYQETISKLLKEES